MPRRFRSLIALIAVSVVACRTPRPDTGTTLAADDPRVQHTQGEGSTIGAADLLEVRVYQEADLSGVYRVSPEGTIDFPLCGKVSTAGMTSSQAADALTHCLGDKYLKHPQVTVLIREYNSKKIFVFGEVQKAGTFPYEQDMSIIQAITVAGGFTKTAAKNSTNVTRLVDGQEQKIRVPVEDIAVGRQKNFAVQPGDIVFVPESFF